jgi:hypothetical protein
LCSIVRRSLCSIAVGCDDINRHIRSWTRRRLTEFRAVHILWSNHERIPLVRLGYTLPDEQPPRSRPDQRATMQDRSHEHWAGLPGRGTQGRAAVADLNPRVTGRERCGAARAISPGGLVTETRHLAAKARSSI